MLKTLIVSLFVASSVFYAQTNVGPMELEAYFRVFYEARSEKDLKTIQSLLQELEAIKLDSVNGKLAGEILSLLSECYLEVAQLLPEGRESEAYLKKSLQFAKDAVKEDPLNGRAYYAMAMASAILIDFVNVFQKLTLMNDFDQYIEKAILYNDDPVYKGLSIMAKAIRYMSAPWPFGDLKKADENFRQAEKYLESYSGLYFHWAQLQLKLGNRELARQLFEKVTKMDPHPMFKRQHEEHVQASRDFLNLKLK